jgi:predicted transcriptional regulator of viral defense system
MQKRSTQPPNDRFAKALARFKKSGGILRTTQALREGIHPATLYALRDSGAIDMLSRGVYRLASSAPLGNPDLVTVAIRVPEAVVCLISALSFHRLTTQIPHAVHIALPKGTTDPRISFPPIKTYRFGTDAFAAGVETHRLDSMPVRIFSPEKTIADCFKFRNSIGIDTAIEALRLYRERKVKALDEIMKYAAICRVTNIVRPYLESIF